MVRVQVLYEYCVTRCLISLAAHVPVAWKLDSAIRTINSQEHHLTSVLRDATPPIRLLVAFHVPSSSHLFVVCRPDGRVSHLLEAKERDGVGGGHLGHGLLHDVSEDRDHRNPPVPDLTLRQRDSTALASAEACVCVWHVVAPVKDKESFCAPPAARRTAPCPSRRCAGCRSRRAASRRRPTS